jgi:imidazolonepropionase-like amidohydrolase
MIHYTGTAMRFVNAALILGLVSMPQLGAAEAVLYHNFTRIDVADHALVDASWMIVEDGVIHEVGEGALPAGFRGERRDMDGSWAIPGLIDGHAHITAGPHKVEVVDGQPLVTIESVDSITRYNALMSLAFGVTTVRNPGGDPEANARYDSRVSAGEWPGPSALHAGAVIQPPPFGGNAFAYPTTREGWFAEAERQAGLGMTYFKLYTGLSPDELALGIEAAHANGLQAIAHLDKVSWLTALDAGIDGLEHALPTSTELLPEAHRAAFDQRRLEGSKHLAEWFRLVDFDGPEMQALFATLAERQTTLNLTLMVNEMLAYADDLSELVDDSVVSTIHPASWAAMSQFLTMGAANWTPDEFEMARAALSKVQEFTLRIFEADIPLLIGTDGNGAGPLMAMEMQLHADAGIPSWDVLDLATRRAAITMGLENTGQIAAGFDADVAFLAANPLESFDHLRDVRAVLSDGRYFERQALVEAAQELLD